MTFIRNALSAMFLGGLLLSACSEQEELDIHPQGQIVFTVDKFQANEYSTRTSVDVNNNYQIVWTEGDVVGVFPREGYQEPFTIPSNQLGQSEATFDGGYWSLKDGLTYAAYYPFNNRLSLYAEYKQKITVSYGDQQQNGNICDISKHDYTYSDWMTSQFGSINLKMHHLGAFIILKLPIPVTTNYHSLKMSTTQDIIPITGFYDLTDSKPVIWPNQVASSMYVQLNAFTGTADQTADIYMMLPPMNLSQNQLTFTLYTNGGTCVYTVQGKEIKAATKYVITPKPISSTVPGTTEAWLRKYGIIEGGGTEGDTGVDPGGNGPDFGWGN